MFVVVAIVIFGIFVVLSYTVFGSDGLSASVSGLFETVLDDTNNRLSSVDDSEEIDDREFGVNLIDINNLGVYSPYHTRVNVVSEDEFYITRNMNNTSGWVAIQFTEPLQLTMETYTVSGYLYINGEPAIWDDYYQSKRVSTYASSDNFYVDNETGYFEGTQHSLRSRYFFHTKVAYDDNVENADVLTFRHLRVEHGDESTNPNKPN